LAGPLRRGTATATPDNLARLATHAAAVHGDPEPTGRPRSGPHTGNVGDPVDTLLHPALIDPVRPRPPGATVRGAAQELRIGSTSAPMAELAGTAALKCARSVLTWTAATPPG
jgi:hypothetical protein